MRSSALALLSGLALLTLSAAACSNGTGGTSTTGSSGSSTSGSSGMSDGSYTIVPVDPAAPPKASFAMAISADDRVGIVYFREDAGRYAGMQNTSVFYTEVQNNAVKVAPELVNQVQLVLGATVAFQPSGQPAVGYLGGGDANGAALDQDAGPTGSLYWVQSQAELDYRKGPNSWSNTVCMASSMGGACDLPNMTAGCATGSGGPFNWGIDFPAGTVDMSAEALCDNPFGVIVGLWPSLLFDGGTAVMALRDVHEGQYPIQDWGASDAKMCFGGPSAASYSWSAPMTISAAGNNKTNGFGVHNQLIYAENGVLALVNDSSAKDEGSLASGSGPINFTKQTGSNTQTNADWTAPIDPFNPSGAGQTLGNPGTGPSMVYDHTFGYGVVATDITAAAPTLSYVSSPDGASWSTRESVYGLGSGGFFPQLAVNPTTHNPVVAFTICSLSPGLQPDTHACSSTDAALETAERTPQGWAKSAELSGNFWTPKFGYLSTGKKVFVYSDLDNGGLYVAFEN